MYVYDIETYPNIFTLACQRIPDNAKWIFEISERRNDLVEMIAFLHSIAASNGRMVGYNNNGFDYPVIHLALTVPGVSYSDLYNKAMAIIHSARDDWSHVVWANDQIIPQIDLYKIHHFDNVARATSLKMLEFNMRSSSIQDLPYEPGSTLTHDQMDHLIEYNFKDVSETVKFLHESKSMIEFREELSVKYARNFMNHNDTKIGKDYFIMRLEEAGVPCYDNRKPRQTRRHQINLKDALFPYVQFITPKFQHIHSWFANQIITETKGVFKDVNVTLDNFKFVFGLGGIHGSVESQVVVSDDEYIVRDADVTSYYPSLAIANRVFPEHLSETFCDIYKDVFQQRRNYKKGTPENAMLKLALNGVYGDSNNQYSPFYDSLYTMKITINGQLLLCMLAEQLMQIPGLQMIQINTDGLTVKMPRSVEPMYELICDWWQKFTCLDLEFADYSRMMIRDVNNYIAEYISEDGAPCPCGCGMMSGKVKRKGAYEYDRGWSQNHSSMIIPKAAEAALVHGKDIAEFIMNHDDLYDFMLRTKVPRSSRLQLEFMDGGIHQPCQNITRYYITHDGGDLIKLMPPTPGQRAKNPNAPDRRIGISVGWKVTECNDITKAIHPINYDYYIQEAEKLVRPLL